MTVKAKTIKKRKKYSLFDRKNHYDRVLDKEKEKAGDSYLKKPLNKKEQHAFGFLQAVERGRPLNFDERTLEFKKGVLAGEKAKRRAEKIKF